MLQIVRVIKKINFPCLVANLYYSYSKCLNKYRKKWKYSQKQNKQKLTIEGFKVKE